MHLERILQVGVASLVALSTVLLGMGEQRTVLPLAAVIVALGSVYVTDVRGWIRLSPRMADLLGVGAAFLALVQWQRETTDAGLLALLNFVVYVQFVLQLRQKGIAAYWLLMSLSLMEAAVATALNESLGFGVLLLAYVFVAIGVLTIFYIYREQVRATGGSSDVWRSTPAGRANDGRIAQRQAQEPVFVGHISRQQSDEAANLPLARLVGNLGGLALGMACLVFIIVPRPERGAWREGEEESTQRIVGFSNEVKLGELGSISESHEEVMQVYLQDPDTSLPIELADEPLFRGVVLTTYDDRKWKQELFAGQRLQAQRPPRGTKAINQRFVIRPLDTDVLFSMYPAYSRNRRADILWSEQGEQFKLVRSERSRSGHFEYELLTTGIVDRRPPSIVPARSLLDPDHRNRLLKLPPPRSGEDPLVGTKALAERIVRVIPQENHLERARVLTNYLRDPTNFTYTLAEVRRDAALDPVEDFLTRHPLGHCEYFASSLTLMLRAVGIPARLAIGFKGGDWTGTHYQVRAMHAHAWVEAYLAPENLPEQAPLGVDAAKGAWLILDPTTGALAAPTLSAGGYVIEGFKRLVTTMGDAWRTYVLGLNHSRQQEGIYEPIHRGIVSVAAGVRDPEVRRAFARALLERLSPAYWGLTNGGWFSWRGALVAIVVMLLGTWAYHLGRPIVGRLWRLTIGAASTAERGRGDVEFFRRLESLLAARALVRSASQTPREFALAVGGQLAESTQTKRAAPLARQLVELFYRVRFGRKALDSQEAAAVEQALSDLAGALALGSGSAVQDRR
jgi:protein-glutamine gamma-glutamyltransferase